MKKEPSKRYKAFQRPIYPERHSRLFYSAKHRGYIVRGNRVPVEMVIASQDEYFRFIAGEIEHIFPQFNPEKHSVDDDWDYDAPKLNFEGIPLLLSEVVPEHKDEMPNGIYRAYVANGDLILKAHELGTVDRYIDIDRGASGILEDYRDFLKLRAVCEKEGRRHKSGVFIYGPPGTGKTREIIRVFENTQTEDYTVIIIGNGFPNLGYLEELRSIMHGRNVVFILEEITERAKEAMEDLLSFTDGEHSWDNAYIIATTNYPEELPQNVIDRPGRFEMILEYGPLDKKQTKKFMLGYGVAEDQIDYYIDEIITSKLSLDYLRYIAFQHVARGKDLGEVMDYLETTRRRISSTFKASIGLGIGSTTNKRRRLKESISSRNKY